MAAGKTFLETLQHFNHDRAVELFGQFVGGLIQLECSEQSNEGRHAQMHKQILHAPHCSSANLSCTARFGELEKRLAENAKDLLPHHRPLSPAHIFCVSFPTSTHV
jgi:hypothetical protein